MGFLIKKIVLTEIYLVLGELNAMIRKGVSMDKPMLVLKRFGHQVHLMVQKEAKRCGIEFMGVPQGQVLRF